jgi:thioredoxin 1
METTEMHALITNNPAVLLYFYNDNCAPCRVLRPKVQHMIDVEFPNVIFYLVNTELEVSVSANFGVFASPTLLVFFEGKEYIRESKNISISALHDKIERIYKMIF